MIRHIAPAILLGSGLASARGGELPPADSIKPVEIVRTGDYSEGVVVDHDGNLYISHGKTITRVSPEGRAATWAETGAPNGHKVLADGTHLVCDGSHHAVLHLDAGGKLLAPASQASDGEPLRIPNDLTLDPAGGFYFTDPVAHDPKRPAGKVHHADAQGVTHTVATGLAFPNGIVLRPGGKELLVGESLKNRVVAFPVLATGKLGASRILIDLPAKGPGQVADDPDGMALDGAGNLYIAHHGMGLIQVVDPAGKLIRSYPAGNLRASNVAFAGPKRDRLYTTGGEPGALFRLDLPGVEGLAILPAKSE